MGRSWKSIRHAGMALVAIISIFFMGCTRDVKDSTSVRLSLPNTKANKAAGALGTDDIGVIIVNVSDVATKKLIKVWEWSRHSNCADPSGCSAPSQISLEIPKGDRLIQLLVVEEDEAVGTMVFKYGDVSKNLQSSNEEVSITLTAAGGATMQGHVYGRYMDGSPQGGPSGYVVGKFTPPDNKPQMSIMRSFMFAGWFNNFMAMDGAANFSYYMNGQPLFSNVNLSSPLLAGSTNVFRANIPERRRENSGPGGVSVWEPEPQEKIIVGYFGSNVGAREACYDSTSGPISGLRKPAPDNSDLDWGGTSPTAAQAGREAGGVPYNPISTPGEPCEIANDEFETHIVFRQEQLRNGHDSVAGIKGPFRDFPDGSERKFYTYLHDSGAQTLTVDFKFLPGVTSGAGRVHGVRAFSRVVAGGGDDSDLYGMDGIECEKLPMLGFFSQGADLITTNNQVDAQMVIPGVSTLNNSQWVLCPFIDNGDGTKTFPPAGMKLWFDMNSYSNQLGIRWVGDELSNSKVFGASFGSSVPPIVKGTAEGILNEFYNFQITAGGQNLALGDISSVEFSVDGGTVWAPAYFTTGGPYQGQSVVIVPIKSTPAYQEDLFNALNNSSDQDLRLRVTVTAAAKTALNLPNQVYTSPVIQVLGATGVCPAPGTLEAINTSGNTVISASSLLNGFNVAGGTDIDLGVKLRWSGCPQAFAPIDWMSISTGGSNCFGSNDFKMDPMDQYRVFVSPMDRSGADCSVPSHTIGFRIPSNAGLEGVDFSASPKTITHSTTPSRLGFLMSNENVTSIVQERYLYRLGILGPNAPFKINSVKLNSDGKLTDSGTTGLASGATAYTLGTTSTNWGVPSPASGVQLTNTTIASPVSTSVVSINSNDGGVLGSMDMIIAGVSKKVIAVSDTGVDGGSPFMLIDNGATLELAFVPSNYGNFLNQSLKVFALPTDAGGFPTSPSYAKVLSFYDTGILKVFIVARYGANSQFAFAHMSDHGSAMTANWAPNGGAAGDAVVGAELRTMGSPWVLLAVDGSSDAFFSANLPTFAGTWSGSVTLGTNSALGTNSLLGLVQCEGETFAVGADGSGYFRAEQMVGTGSPSTGGTPLTNGTAIAAYDRVTCLGTSSGGSSDRIFFLYNSTTGANTFFIYNSSGGATCGSASPNQLRTAPANVGFSPASGGFVHAIGAKSASEMGMLLLYNAGSSLTAKVTFLPLSCNGTDYVTGTAQMWGSLAGPAAEFAGFQPLMNGMGGLSSPHSTEELVIFGEKHRFFMLQAR